ncbi:MAG: HAD family phosphatase [Candidatus Marinimicrobia bacterium]|nr:HAD family phosphatase [Candidatus Neomarinimicrobiota bacterium]MCF7828606.1 HAD family phosphatase [Candidatus Neomarinimicrobiota bacterium]MCF7880347.1 HAD family phosphatase [Candidatus Neomarinimicrobiota bacterium]
MERRKFAVIFDMDGVIVDSNPAHKEAIQRFLQRHDQSLSDNELREKVYGRTNRDWLRNTFNGITEEQIAEYIDEKEAIFREIFAGDIRPLPGLQEFLDSLQGMQVPMAVGTSAPQVNADWVLNQTGLREYFEVVLQAEDVTHGKPHPEMYLKSAWALGMRPEDCIIFEDSVSGIEAGRRAGGTVIGVTTTHSREEMAATAFVISDFTEITPEQLPEIVHEPRN